MLRRISEISGSVVPKGGHSRQASRNANEMAVSPKVSPAVAYEDQSGPDTKRRVYMNVPSRPPYSQTFHVGNQIRTSKYTLLTFIPKNALEQLRSVANFYFISLVILQLFDPFKNVDFGLTAAPILFILGVTALKDAFEDYKRHEADTRANNTRTYLLANWRNTNPSPETVPFQFIMIFSYISNRIDLMFGALARILGKLIQWNKKSPADAISRDFPLHIGFSDYPKCAGDVAPPDEVHLDGEESDVNSHVTHTNSATQQSERSPILDVTDPIWKLNLWDAVKVGDWVFIRENDPIPADIVVVSTSEPDNVCYVETKNLDGETNLKIRRGITQLASVKTPAQCAKVNIIIDSELPSANLYTYSGVAILNPKPDGLRPSPEEMERGVGKLVPISPVGILLRGCILRNTGWVIGIVIYTGVDTKVMLNSGETPSKRSKIQRSLNPLIVLNFVILVALCLINACAAAFYLAAYRNEGALWNLGDPNSTLTQSILDFFVAMIIYQNIIPIALYISVEVAKTIQSVFIYWDDDMYDRESDKHVVPQTYNLCDDLGQIEYIFSDKTGTLTANVMEFRMCSINGIVYGDGYITEAKMGAMQREGLTDFDKPAILAKLAQQEQQMRSTLKKDLKGHYVDNGRLSFVDMSLVKDLLEEGEQARAIREFFILLACCHTVLVDIPRDSPEKLIYKAQSPDEAALVAAARDVGVAFKRRAQNSISIEVYGEERTYSVLNVLEFDSDRKRMSVVLRDSEGHIVLLCKGADSVIYERLVTGTDQALSEKTSSDLESFANDGLRTLCLAWRIIPEEQYFAWADTYSAAQNQIVNRDKAVAAAAETIERELILLGATAIEDKLQDGVPECIATLAQAGIKIWVLTGDKVETAINIGFACNLLTRTMVLIVVRATTPNGTADQLKSALNRFWDENGKAIEGDTHALIIDGESLKFALEGSSRELLLELGCRCKAVVCARVSPLQKARVVELVRKGLNALTLAIGDGANDVSMIQEAEVGVGISGKEGLQAVMAADYAIPQFRFLARLLLVHGKWAYVRTAGLIFNYFYKNVLWLFILFWYQFQSGFAADVIPDFTYGQFFNTFFTLLPNIFIGTFDQDLNDETSIKLPEIYQKGIRNDLFTNEQVWIYIADGIYQSVVIYFGVTLAYATDTDPNGLTWNKDAMGTVIAWTAILTVNVYIAMGTYSWNWLAVFAIIATVAVWIIYVLTYAASMANPTYGEIPVLYKQAAYYFVMILVIVTASLPRFIAAAARAMFWPTDTDIVREMQKYNLSSEEKVAAKAGEAAINGDPKPGPNDDPPQYAKWNVRAPLFGLFGPHSHDTHQHEAVPSSETIPAIVISEDSIPMKAVPDHPATQSTSGRSSEGKEQKPSTPPSPKHPHHPPHHLPHLRIATDPVNNTNNNSDDNRGRGKGDRASSTNRRTSFQLASLPARLVGEFVRSVPRRLRAVSSNHPVLHTPQRSIGTIVYMEDEGAGRTPNTGFSFSHESGMEGVVSPRVSVTSMRRRGPPPPHHDRLTLGESLRKSLHFIPRTRNSSREPIGGPSVQATASSHGDISTATIPHSASHESIKMNRERRGSSGKPRGTTLPFLHALSNSSSNTSSTSHSHNSNSEPHLHIQNPALFGPQLSTVTDSSDMGNTSRASSSTKQPDAARQPNPSV
ncbi:hypothetical protein SmJEL517_g05155 [Synchytrium microbalum]|uniref:Phospholipid-transporting ATPase n=1 Tax=Synchytrium microbalum TaxID=1806994 RepID=A0A507BQS6_9FUNG|nr:uncharacterized protein SmJEL517_g05155 [Synchytrium microbalum]TPX31537.1 hypothetical protein SmJEL517_g05155 [Synchytrium microbalum]